MADQKLNLGRTDHWTWHNFAAPSYRSKDQDSSSQGTNSFFFSPAMIWQMNAKVFFFFILIFSFKFPSVHTATKFMHVQAPSVTATPFRNPKAFSPFVLTMCDGVVVLNKWLILDCQHPRNLHGNFSLRRQERGKGFAKVEFCFSDLGCFFQLTFRQAPICWLRFTPSLCCG